MLTIISYFGLLITTLLFTIALYVGLTKIQLI